MGRARFSPMQLGKYGVGIRTSFLQEVFLCLPFYRAIFQHALLRCEKLVGQIYNVGLSDSNVSKKELCEHIQKQLPDFVFIEAPIGKDPDQRNYIVSNDKVEATGYKPEFSMERGIAELIKGFTMIRNTRYGNV